MQGIPDFSKLLQRLQEVGLKGLRIEMGRAVRALTCSKDGGEYSAGEMQRLTGRMEHLPLLTKALVYSCCPATGQRTKFAQDVSLCKSTFGFCNLHFVPAASITVMPTNQCVSRRYTEGNFHLNIQSARRPMAIHLFPVLFQS